MRLDDMTPAHVRRAVELYIEIAWPGEAPPRPRITDAHLAGADTLDKVFALFERPRESAGVLLTRAVFLAMR